MQSPATMPIIVMRAESDELSTVRTELTAGKKFIAVATHLDLYDPEVSAAGPLCALQTSQLQMHIAVGCVV